MQERRVSDYQVVSRSKEADFTSAVKGEISHGWEPLGGVSTAKIGEFRRYGDDPGMISEILYSQAMVMYV